MTRSAVVDASVVLRWFVQDPWTDAAIAVADRFDLIAPALLGAEIANALRNQIRFAGLPTERALKHLDGLWSTISDVEDRPLLPAALRLAADRDHPVYDCVYLALAMREGIPLVTGDMRLARKFGGAPGLRFITLESL